MVMTKVRVKVRAYVDVSRFGLEPASTRAQARSSTKLLIKNVVQPRLAALGLIAVLAVRAVYWAGTVAIRIDKVWPSLAWLARLGLGRLRLSGLQCRL